MSSCISHWIKAAALFHKNLYIEQNVCIFGQQNILRRSIWNWCWYQTLPPGYWIKLKYFVNSSFCSSVKERECISWQGLAFYFQGESRVDVKIPASTVFIYFSGENQVSMVPPFSLVVVFVRFKHSLSIFPGVKQMALRSWFE